MHRSRTSIDISPERSKSIHRIGCDERLCGMGFDLRNELPSLFIRQFVHETSLIVLVGNQYKPVSVYHLSTTESIRRDNRKYREFEAR